MRKICLIAVYSLWILAFTERAAYAYIDPGAGSLFLQLALGGVAGLWVLVRMYGRQLMDKVLRRSGRNES